MWPWVTRYCVTAGQVASVPHLLVQVVMLRLLLVHVVVLVPVHVGVGVAVVRLVGVARRVRGLVAKQSNIKHG